MLKSQDEVEKVRSACQIVREVLDVMVEMVAPGVDTLSLDRKAEEIIRKKGARPAFKGYRGYKHTLCTSLNEEVVHGIPSAGRILKEGDLISIDCGAILNGYFGDAARSLPVGKVDDAKKKLIATAWKALDAGMKQTVVGCRLGDISAAIEKVSVGAGYEVVRDFVGHGIGMNLHEDPQVPNFGNAGTGILLKEGLILALEPMLNMGTYEVEVLADGWTVVTKDRKCSAHVEHTIAITRDGPVCLSD